LVIPTEIGSHTGYVRFRIDRTAAHKEIWHVSYVNYSTQGIVVFNVNTTISWFQVF